MSDLHHNFNRWAPGDEYSHLAQNYAPLDLNISYGEGPHLVSQDGVVYADFIGGYGAVQFGHRHPKIVAAMQQQISSQPYISAILKDVGPGDTINHQIKPGGLDLTTRRFTTPILGEFSRKLAEFSRIPDAVVLPKNGGGEIFETAVKALRAHGVRNRGIPNNEGVIIVFEHCFHGRTSCAVAASSDPGVKRDFGPFPHGFVSVPYNDIPALKRVMEQHKGRISGVMVEPVQGEAGVIIPSDDFLPAVQQLCRDHNTILCLDEIQSGWGRTGKRWAWEHFLETPPDMILTAKAIGAGLVASSACIGRRDIMDIFDAGSDGATMSGSALTCAVGLAAMEVLEEENLCAQSALIGERMSSGLSLVLNSPIVHDVRVLGAWGAVEVESEEMAEAISNYLVTEKYIVCTSAHQAIRLSPPLNTPLKHVNYVVGSIIGAIEKFENNPQMVHNFTLG